MNVEELFNQIGFGKENSVSRPSNERVDRKLRKIIERENTNGDCIISGKSGYYRYKIDLMSSMSLTIIFPPNCIEQERYSTNAKT